MIFFSAFSSSINIREPGKATNIHGRRKSLRIHKIQSESENLDPSAVNIFDRVHLFVMQQKLTESQSNDRYFSLDKVVSYQRFHDDFGPVCLGSIHRFCAGLDEQLKQNKKPKIALTTQPDKPTLTNTVFLLGAYMIMKLDFSPDQVEERFEVFAKRIATFRDISPGKQNFHLHVRDCWAGMWRARSLSWVDFGPSGFDVAEYEKNASMLNGSVHEIVPGKFFVMRGPKAISGDKISRDIHDINGQLISRDFSPAHYAEILSQRNVRVVIRLNAPEYEDKAFTDRGIAVADLRFGVCVPPPADVVGKFLAIAEGVSGPVAVHCRAGLGRTGTLIGLYMMRHYGFSAREAMGWLRIVRPGSVVGSQQQFLCAKEAVMRRASLPPRPPSTPGPCPAPDDPEVPLMPPPLGASAGLAAVERHIREVGAHVDGRVRAVQARIEAMQSSGDIPRLTLTPSRAPSARATNPSSASPAAAVAGEDVASGPAAAAGAAAAARRRRQARGLELLLRGAAAVVRADDAPTTTVRRRLCVSLGPGEVLARANSL